VLAIPGIVGVLLYLRRTALKEKIEEAEAQMEEAMEKGAGGEIDELCMGRRKRTAFDSVK
jgi:hypothetical protein